VSIGSRNGGSEFSEAIELIAENRLHVKDLITKVVPIEQLPEAITEKLVHPDKFRKITSVL
jgi:L-gulonate 5-dehydrogenase